MAKILIIGCGDIGSALAEKLAQQGHLVTGIKRNLPKHESAVNYIKLDVTKAGELACLPFDFDQIIYIISPDGGLISAYEDAFRTGVDNVLARFSEQKNAVSFTFVSSSRVYGQNQGEWVNEVSETVPSDERGQILLKAEHKFLSFNDKTTIVRFSGIYGRSNYFLSQLKKGVEIQKDPAYYTNRIHRSDCVGVLAFIVNKKIKSKMMADIYIASDNDPAPKWDVASFLVAISNINKPKALKLSKSANQNKRLDNKRLLQEGYKFKYNSYKEGYRKTLGE